ncbi:MAG: hypothetical protein KGO53_12615 [Alphaproteobacteria bacterium]|nr:hypothetical protein [Alphaproteobacteria bacterium]
MSPAFALHALQRRLGLLPAVAFCSAALMAALVLWLQYGVWADQVAARLNSYDRMRAVASYSAAQTTPAITLDASNFIAGATGAARDAALATSVKTLADAHAMQVLRSENLAMPGKSMIGLSLQLSGTYPNFLEFLKALDAARPALFLDRLVASNPAAQIPDQSSEIPMNFEMQVSARTREGG